LLPNKGQQTAQGKADVRNHGRRLLVRPWDTNMSGLLPRSSVVVTWKAGCGESRTSGLEWGKDREVLPITTGEVAIPPCYPASYGWAAPSAPGWVRVPEHPAHRRLHGPELATRLPRPILEQSSPRSTTMKPNQKPLIAGVGCPSTHPDPVTSSQPTMARALPSKNRQVRVVYRCWNFAGKVSLSLTLAEPRRAFQAAMLTRHVVAATGDRA
jgi:hypothetical protein